MARALLLGALAALLVALCLEPAAGASLAGCNNLVDQFKALHAKEAVPYNGTNMLYFLHVPRTAGRTFFSCLLRNAFPASKRCPKAYDHLRINMSVPHCSLLSSHDDFSVLSFLPPEVSVVHQFRDPVDRFLSAYEFAVEIASREWKKPPLRPPVTAGDDSGAAAPRPRPKLRGGQVSTLDVWPWSFLAPFFADDMRTRRSALRAGAASSDGGDTWQELLDHKGQTYYLNKRRKSSKLNLTAAEMRKVLPYLDPYDNPMYMSLRDFARHPIATELLHNGGFFQVMGLTNYSHWGSAGEMRHCMQAHPDVEAAMLGFAQRRMRTFTHVGTTDRLYESAAAVAAAMDRPLSGPAYGGGENQDANVELGGDRRAVPASTEEEGEETSKGRNGLAALHRAVRDKRAALKAVQSELHAAVNAAVKPDPASVEALKRSAAEKRAALLAAQEALHAGVAAAHGPQGRSGAHGGSGSPPGDAGQDDMDNNAYDDGEDSNSNDSKDDADDEKDHEEGSSGGGDGYTAHSRRRRARRLRHTRRLLEDAAAHHRKARRASKDNVTLALPLGPAFVKCANKAQATCARRRKSSMASLKMPDGRTPTFSKAARKKIPQDVIDFIRSQSQLDVQLHALALELLDGRIEEYKKQGKWEDPPKHDRVAEAAADLEVVGGRPDVGKRQRPSLWDWVVGDGTSAPSDRTEMLR